MIRVFILITLLLFSISCNKDNCSDKLGFELDYHLFTDININGMSYCEIVNNAMNKDSIALKNLLKVKVKDFASYQHGAVFIRIIEKITESSFIEVVRDISNEDLVFIVNNYINAGFEFIPDERYRYSSIKKSFPELFEYYRQNCTFEDVSGD